MKNNREVLYSLGIIANKKILDEIYKSCSYLKWEKFEDTMSLNQLEYQKVIVSNFHNGLNEIIDDLFPNQFSEI
jgi:hypothetical protein